jgi:hypothetical protein
MLFPETQPATATIVRYMEKALGRKAEHEINMPVLSSRNHSIRRAMLVDTWLLIALKKKTR